MRRPYILAMQAQYHFGRQMP